MKLAWVLLGLLLAMCVVVAAAFIIGEEPIDLEGIAQGHGTTHPDFATINQGGTGADRHTHILWLGWTLGILEISFFVCLLGLGARKKEKMGVMKKPLFICLAIYLGIWTLMIVTYRTYMGESVHSFVLSFPKPTAVMLYMIWPMPLAFMFLFILMFDRWFFTPEDLERFEQIVKTRREREKDAS